MLALLTLLAALDATPPGASSAPSPSPPASLPETIDDHTYHLYRPANLPAGQAVPLVVMLHGYLGSADQAEDDFHWDALADKNGFEVVYPDGNDGSWNAQDCCGKAAIDDLDDVAFFNDLIAMLAKPPAPAIDRQRLYVAGYSNGAMFAYRLACESKVPIAAIGAVAGVMNRSCPKPQNRPSIVAIHGLADELVRYNGGNDFPGNGTVPKTIAAWRTADGCAKPSTKKTGSVTTEIATCSGGRNVELISIAGARHQWPGGRWTAAEARYVRETYGLPLDKPSDALDATATIWSFFAAHPLP